MTGRSKDIPSLLKLWGGIYNALPKLYIAGTQFPVGLTLLSTLFLSLVRFGYRYLYVTVFEFDISKRKTVEMIACNTSMTHSLLLVPALWQALRDQPYRPSASIQNTPKYYQDAVTALLQFCTGYMIYDFIFMVASNNWQVHPDDVAFIGHHLVTMAYMTQTRVLGAGHISAMALMWSGEFTNPMQNTHCITRFAIQMSKEGTFWHVIHPYVEWVFAVTYAFFRAVVGPIQIVHITYDLLLTKEGRTNIPLYVSLLWVFMIWGIILGSIPWTVEGWEMARDGLTVKYHQGYDYGPRYEI